MGLQVLPDQGGHPLGHDLGQPVRCVELLEAVGTGDVRSGGRRRRPPQRGVTVAPHVQGGPVDRSEAAQGHGGGGAVPVEGRGQRPRFPHGVDVGRRPLGVQAAAPQRPAEQPAVARQEHPLGHDRQPEEGDVERTQRLGGAQGHPGHRRRVGGGQGGHGGHPLGGGAAQPPGHGAAPVVAHDGEAGRAEVVGHGQGVGAQRFDAVRPGVQRSGPGRVPPLGRGDDVEPGSCEPGHHLVPRRRRLREAVEEDDQRPVRGTRLLDVEDAGLDRDLDVPGASHHGGEGAAVSRCDGPGAAPSWPRPAASAAGTLPAP